MHGPTKPQRHSPQEFAQLGIEKLAYVKRVFVDGTPAYAIHAADGTELVQAVEPEAALALAREHELELVRVH